MIISAYCYQNYLLYSTKKGDVFLCEIENNKLKQIKQWNLATSSIPFFNIDVSMEKHIMLSTYESNKWLIGDIPNLIISTNLLNDNFNYITKQTTTEQVYAASSNGEIIKLHKTGHIIEVIPNTILPFSYPEMIIEYLGEDGFFFKKGEMYVCWKSQDKDGIRGIKQLYNYDFYHNIPFEGMAFCGDYLIAFTHNTSETILYIYNCTNDALFVKQTISVNNELFPYPGIYSNGVVGYVHYKDRLYVFKNEILESFYCNPKSFPILCNSNNDVKLLNEEHERFTLEKLTITFDKYSLLAKIKLNKTVKQILDDIKIKKELLFYTNLFIEIISDLYDDDKIKKEQIIKKTGKNLEIFFGKIDILENEIPFNISTIIGAIVKFFLQYKTA